MSKLFKSFILVFLLVSAVQGQSNSSGANSPIAVGHITAINGQVITVQTKKLVRKLTLTDKTKVEYISMLDEASKELKVGYAIKGKNTDGILKVLLVTYPVQNPGELTAEQLKLTPGDVFKQTDKDGDGLVSYVEFSKHVYYSPKHGPDKFLKVDKDKSGLLNLKEFEVSLASVTKWKMSRKSPQAWFEQADKDKDGGLTIMEYTTITTGKNHVDNTFKKKDKDKSGKISLEEWLKSFSK